RDILRHSHVFPRSRCSLFLFLNALPPPHLPTLSLHDALPISRRGQRDRQRIGRGEAGRRRTERRIRRAVRLGAAARRHRRHRLRDRKSTRLNSSHEWISYAVFCLKKKNNTYLVATTVPSATLT